MTDEMMNLRALILAFTDFGVENLVELIKIHKEMKSPQER